MARKILLADDSVTAQNMGRKILADAGYEVITVNNGSAALKKIAELKPDLIVLDVYMPGYSGLEVCQRLKDAPETERIPVLLTVGKLEPFKPEEARRVRAEGFIVKPFEASELLSALSKLEDKVVPRSESSKPGRFARALAAVEGRERNDSAEEDSGWKNRISFPHKKKDNAEEVKEDGDDPAIYNAVNKDLRTVVPHEVAHEASRQQLPAKESAAKPASTVDVAAVAPSDLPKDSFPKDVTLEEIAAIAAAAAQVQAAAAVSKETPEPKPETKVASESAVPVQAETKAEAKHDAKDESEEDEIPAATFAEHKREEKIESEAASAQAKPEAPKERTVVPNRPEVAATISAIEPANGESWNGGGSGNGVSHPAAPPVEVPITMAAAAAASSAQPRWTAVAVAIDAAEAAISLEQEMHKAQAAPVAANLVAPAPAPVVETMAVTTPTEKPQTQETPATVPVDRAATREETELAHALSVSANTPARSAPVTVAEPAPVTEAKIEPEPPAPAPELASPSTAGLETPKASRFESAVPEVAQETAVPPIPELTAVKESLAGVENRVSSDTAVESLSTSATVPQPTEPVSTVAEAPAVKAIPAGGTADMANKESELSATTAAAWASWRQIRHSDEPTEPTKARKQDDEDDEPTSASEVAAMAVAAGAEKRPEEMASASDPRGIASIVDSVLAELRPKIVEEISRKLGEKK